MSQSDFEENIWKIPAVQHNTSRRFHPATMSSPEKAAKELLGKYLEEIESVVKPPLDIPAIAMESGQIYFETTIAAKQTQDDMLTFVSLDFSR